MTPLFKKLNFKNQLSIVCLNSPTSFETEVEAMAPFTTFYKNSDVLNQVMFALVFATKQAEIDQYMVELAPKLEGDAILWFCYPKKSSKNYTCEFNRDTGWEVVGSFGWEGVRMVAIDADWSALRFRKVEYIKNFTRRKSMAITKEGKKRATK